MTDWKKTITKGTLGTVAAGAMALASANPAMAKDRHKDGIDAGDVIAGALVIGGIAALAGAFDNDRDRYRDRRYRDRHYRDHNYRGNYHYNRGYQHSYSYNQGNPQRAVERCIRTAERQARKFGNYRYADVTQIRDVDRTRYGFKVKGRMVVEGYRGQDRGKFTCWVRPGDRPQIDFKNIRRL